MTRSPVPSNMDPSDHFVLFEPDKDSVPLEQLDVQEGLLEVQNQKQSYLVMPVGNNTKNHPTTKDSSG